jgi:hypothetical protein
VDYGESIRSDREVRILKLGPIQALIRHGITVSIFYPFIAINEIPAVAGKPVLAVLYDLCCKVESILMAIEAEAKAAKS